eukprot:2988229-Amphidinium_carterae.1
MTCAPKVPKLRTISNKALIQGLRRGSVATMGDWVTRSAKDGCHLNAQRNIGGDSCTPFKRSAAASLHELWPPASTCGWTSLSPYSAHLPDRLGENPRKKNVVRLD